MGNKVGTLEAHSGNYELCPLLSIPLLHLSTISNLELVNWLQQNFVLDRRIRQAIEALQDPMMVVKDKSYGRNASGLYLHISFYDKRIQTGVHRTALLKEKDVQGMLASDLGSQVYPGQIEVPK